MSSDPQPSTRGRLYSTLAAGALGLGALTYVGLVDPHQPGSVFPACPFKALTGWNCPGCGGLRMTHDLLHGDWTAAAVDNVFLLVGLPMFAIWALWRLRVGRRVFTPVVLIGIAVAALGWTLIRNLPGFPLVPLLVGESVVRGDQHFVAGGLDLPWVAHPVTRLLQSPQKGGGLAELELGEHQHVRCRVSVGAGAGCTVPIVGVAASSGLKMRSPALSPGPLRER